MIRKIIINKKQRYCFSDKAYSLLHKNFDSPYVNYLQVMNGASYSDSFTDYKGFYYIDSQTAENSFKNISVHKKQSKCIYFLTNYRNGNHISYALSYINSEDGQRYHNNLITLQELFNVIPKNIISSLVETFSFMKEKDFLKPITFKNPHIKDPLLNILNSIVIMEKLNV